MLKAAVGGNLKITFASPSNKSDKKEQEKNWNGNCKAFMLHTNAKSWVIKSEVNIHKRGPLYVIKSVPNFSIRGHLIPELNV